jgi:hypothetical protein
MPKRSLSPHQKQIRFFTGFSVFIVIVVALFLFWLANRGLAAH